MSFEKELKTELEKLNNRGPSAEIVNRIKDFDEELNLEGISTGRRYTYILRLRKIASLIPEKFLHPSEKTIKLVVSKIKDTKVKCGSGDEHLPTDKLFKDI
ncbi:MAG: hypothetical protein QXW48_01160 [Thermoplasmata archaeon]